MSTSHGITLIGIVLDAVEGVRPELAVLGRRAWSLRYDGAVRFFLG
ncbi:hypothetical protein [Rhizobium leguminosarum]|nr:hypothetical protein [Rhizobium leguminosarum]